jgi:hypothetical protein
VVCTLVWDDSLFAKNGDAQATFQMEAEVKGKRSEYMVTTNSSSPLNNERRKLDIPLQIALSPAFG